MKKSKAIFVALLACAYGVSADTTTSYDAELVARGWSRLNGAAFGSLGKVKSVFAEQDTDGTTLWYTVVMDKGAAIVAPDDEIEPVIAVLPGSDGVLPAGTPLRAILTRDLRQRLAGVATSGGGLKFLALSAAAASTESPERAKWKKLLDSGGSMPLSVKASYTPATIVRLLDGWSSDSKVGDVQTLRFWNQQNSTSYFSNWYVFNKYTPGNSPCGCVATAGSAVMHYFRVPSGKKLSNGCSYNGRATTLATKGGDYDWSLIDKLNLRNGSPVTLSADALEVLARVAYDCGVGCGMAYGDEGSGSYTVSLMRSMRNVFSVKNAQLVTKEGGEHGYGEGYDLGSANYANIIYNQIRGGAPVVMGIDGHEVVAVGYGYDANKTDLTYVFLGWGGSYDAWYALPTIETKATVAGGTYTSTFVDEVITEIAPADDKFVAVVGRLVDADGLPVAGDVITMANGEEVVTDENGYWGTRVSPNDECYVIDSIGEYHEYELGEAAKSTTTSGYAAGTLASAMPDAMTIELQEPSVRVGGEEGIIYGSLSAALKAVEEDGTPGQTVEILQPTTFGRSVSVSVDCTIFATNAVAAEGFVRFRDKALLTVTGNAKVTLTNVVFNVATHAATTINVTSNAVLQVGGVCEIESIATHTATNLVVIDVLSEEDSAFLVNCAEAQDEGDTFAITTLDLATAEPFAYQMMHATKTRLGGEACYDETLGTVAFRWLRGARVPRKWVRGKLKLGDGDFVGYRAFLDVLEDLELAESDAEAVTYESAEFCRKINKPYHYIIRGEPLVEGDDRWVLTATSGSGFALGDDASLMVSNIVFTGFRPKNYVDEACFVSIDGGAFKMDDGAELNNITGQYDYGSGVVNLDAGEMTMRPGSAIINCFARGLSSGRGYGGAVCVMGAGCSLNLEGGVISNCVAGTYGGGVFSCGWGNDAGIRVSGPLTVVGNRSKNYGGHDDIYIDPAEASAGFKLAGPLTEGSRIGVRYSAEAKAINLDGAAFAVNEAGVGPEDTATLYSFFNDAKLDDENGTNRVAAVSADGKMLVWTLDPRDPRQCSEDEATARLIGADGGNPTFWYEVSDALSEATNNCVVEVMRDGRLTGTVAVKGTNVVLRPSVSEPSSAVLARDTNACVTVGAGRGLTIERMTIAAADGVTNDVVFLDVAGGLLKIDGVSLLNIYSKGEPGEKARNANPVTVSDYGTLVMSNSTISDCCNCSADWTGASERMTDAGAGGGLLVDKATAYLTDVEIRRCGAYAWGGGVYACNEATVYVSGDVLVLNNSTAGVMTNNFEVADTSRVILTDEMTGDVRMTTKANSLVLTGDTNLVATVGYDWTGRISSLTNSAANFTRDLDGDKGIAVTNGTTALIVWASAVTDGLYTNPEDGLVYGSVEEASEPTYEVAKPTPIAFKSVTHEDSVWTVTLTNLVVGAKYSVFATNSLEGGFLVEGVKPVTNFTAEAGGEFELKIPLGSAPVYLRATAEENTIIRK